VFKQEDFSFSVDEHEAIGTYLGTVEADDLDTDDVIT
jgi:hypothetical protein